MGHWLFYSYIYVCIWYIIAAHVVGMVGKNVRLAGCSRRAVMRGYAFADSRGILSNLPFFIGFMAYFVGD